MSVRYRRNKKYPHYRVGDDGSVWTNYYGGWKPKSIRRLKRKDGTPTYCMVDFHVDGQHIPKYVHRLVLEAFIGPCPKGMECRHLDGNPANNQLLNLMWDSHTNNERDKRAHGTLVRKHPNRPRGEVQHLSKLTEDTVRSARIRYVSHINSRRKSGYRKARDGFVKSLAEEHNVTTTSMSMAIKGETWAHVN